MQPIRIAMWSGPRNISTAMMRAWGNRPDTVVVDEPFYAYYLKATGKKHPCADEVIAAGEIDCRSWAQFFLKWIVAHPVVTCVIPATNNPQHIEDNMAAGLGRLPDAKMRQRMIAFVSSL